MQSNILSQVNVDSPLPTFVEMHFAESMPKVLCNMFRFGLTLLSEHSAIATRLLPVSNEIFFSLNALLDYWLLKHANASFSGLLFGLRNGTITFPSWPSPGQSSLAWKLLGPPAFDPVPEHGKDSTAQGAIISTPSLGYTEGGVPERCGTAYTALRFQDLGKSKKILSVVMVTLKVYLQQLLQERYNMHVDMAPDAEELRNAYRLRYPWRSKLIDALWKLYPIVHVIVEGSSFFYKLMFLLELTPYYSPLHRLTGIAVRRAGQNDNFAASSPNAKRAILVAQIAFATISWGTQLLQLQSTSFGSTSGGLGDGGGAIPPPPVLGKDVPLPHDHTVPEPGVCPVCAKRITNPAVNTATGVLCCFPCLHDYVTNNRKCPLTSKPSCIENIRRVFEA